VRLDRLATLYLAKPLRKLAPLPGEGCVSILMYHRISALPEPGFAPYYRVNTSPARFAEQMAFLHQEQYKVVDLVDALSLLQANAFTRKHVVLTFDDGYADFAQEAFPILQNYGFTATVFLPTSFISPEPNSFKDTPCLTWAEVKQLRQAGIRFGSHTVSHPTLYDLTWAEIETQLRDSKARLEEMLEEPVTTFAYPYAYPEADSTFTKQFSALLRDKGYECCVTTRIGVALKNDDPFSLKRLPLNDCDDTALFRAKLEGGYNWLSLPQRLRKKAGNKSRVNRLRSIVEPSVH
jgi:peptidoglycan/xylan/chitin deacetylase (PgdA/CDA1 family)